MTMEKENETKNLPMVINDINGLLASLMPGGIFAMNQ
jgi:hypothetical protein